MRSGLDRARADERVDEAALPHVGVADHADRHRHLDLAVARVVLQELQQLLASDALAAPSQLVLGRCGSSSLGAANVELLALGRALDGNGGQLSSEVLEPGRDVLLRDQVDLVQDQHDALARVLLLNVLLHLNRAATQRITSIQHLQDHICVLHDLVKLPVVCSPRVLDIAGFARCPHVLLLKLEIILPGHCAISQCSETITRA
mmetsp:Transcript_34086/g.81255  ORF Transcript_34086/g.81255 Transcript_34086/m.81255 type:complete len:204 (-) Transcript_34086:427-1038(-)